MVIEDAIAWHRREQVPVGSHSTHQYLVQTRALKASPLRQAGLVRWQRPGLPWVLGWTFWVKISEGRGDDWGDKMAYENLAMPATLRYCMGTHSWSQVRQTRPTRKQSVC